MKHFYHKCRLPKTVAWLFTAKRLHSKAQGRDAAEPQSAPWVKLEKNTYAEGVPQE